MSVIRRERPADSTLIERVTRVAYETTVSDATTPDGCWDIVIMKHRGEVRVLQTGLITKPVPLAYEAGDEYVCISFKPGVFMPSTPNDRMVDHSVFRPTVDPRRFWLDGETFEIPTFENAEGLVSQLIRRDILVRDEIVAGIVDGKPRAISPRSVQRHFRRSTGLTAKRFEQIQRACKAVELLRGGHAVVKVAIELGFADQAHLTRSLKALMGRTPGVIARMP